MWIFFIFPNPWSCLFCNKSYHVLHLSRCTAGSTMDKNITSSHTAHSWRLKERTWITKWRFWSLQPPEITTHLKNFYLHSIKSACTVTAHNKNTCFQFQVVAKLGVESGEGRRGAGRVGGGNDDSSPITLKIYSWKQDFCCKNKNEQNQEKNENNSHVKCKKIS